MGHWHKLQDYSNRLRKLYLRNKVVVDLLPLDGIVTSYCLGVEDQGLACCLASNHLVQDFLDVDPGIGLEIALCSTGSLHLFQPVVLDKDEEFQGPENHGHVEELAHPFH